MTADQVIVSVSGVRGIVGRGLTPAVAGRFGVIDLYYFSAAALVITGALGYWKLESHKPDRKQAA